MRDAVIKKYKFARVTSDILSAYSRDDGNTRVAAITYYGFLALLPGLLAVLSIFDLFFQHDPHLRNRLIHSTLATIPVVGPSLQGKISFVKSHGITLVITLFTLAWASRGGAVALQDSLCDIYQFDQSSRSFFSRIKRAYTALILIGIGVFVPTIIGSLTVPVLLRIVAIICTIGWNIGLLWLIYRVLTDARMSLFKGAVVGGVLLSVIQLLGAFLVRHALTKSQPLYGTLALALALMLWISLQTRAVLLGAESNKVLTKRNAHK